MALKTLSFRATFKPFDWRRPRFAKGGGGGLFIIGPFWFSWDL